MQNQNPATAQADVRPLSDTLQMLLHYFDGAVFIQFGSAAQVVAMKLQTARNQLAAGTFPVPTHKVGGRRVVWVDDLARYIDAQSLAQSLPPAPLPRRSPPLKSERLKARAGGITVKEMRAAQAVKEGAK